jgi:hypothetical protein
VTVEELDLDALLLRKPEVAIIDEIAHTNSPGSRNRKRYQDVLEILQAQINVICAFNVQHLESLNDLVLRVTGVVVRETVPDTFLKQADQVVNLDLAAEDLLDRLRAGKIYAAEKIPGPSNTSSSPRTSRHCGSWRYARSRRNWNGAPKARSTPTPARQSASRAGHGVHFVAVPLLDGLLRKGSAWPAD